MIYPRLVHASSRVPLSLHKHKLKTRLTAKSSSFLKPNSFMDNQQKLLLLATTATTTVAGILLSHFFSSRSKREVIHTDKGPKAVGPYSQAIKANGFVFVSGQCGFIPETGEFAAQDVAGQAEQVLKNIGAILEAAGSSYDKVVKCTVLLRDMNDFAKLNEVYAKYFTKDQPARATFAVAGLPKNALVEIECIALA